MTTSRSNCFQYPARVRPALREAIEDHARWVERGSPPMPGESDHTHPTLYPPREGGWETTE